MAIYYNTLNLNSNKGASYTWGICKSLIPWFYLANKTLSLLAAFNSHSSQSCNILLFSCSWTSLSALGFCSCHSMPKMVFLFSTNSKPLHLLSLSVLLLQETFPKFLFSEFLYLCSQTHKDLQHYLVVPVKHSYLLNKTRPLKRLEIIPPHFYWLVSQMSPTQLVPDRIFNCLPSNVSLPQKIFHLLNGTTKMKSRQPSLTPCPMRQFPCLIGSKSKTSLEFIYFFPTPLLPF